MNKIGLEFAKLFLPIRKSIHVKLTVIFMMLIMAILGAWWIISNVFLENYYYVSKQESMEQTYNTIDNMLQNYNLTTDDYDIRLKKITDDYNVSLIIQGSAYSYYSSHDYVKLIQRLSAYMLMPKSFYQHSNGQNNSSNSLEGGRFNGFSIGKIPSEETNSAITNSTASADIENDNATIESSDVLNQNINLNGYADETATVAASGSDASTDVDTNNTLKSPTSKSQDDNVVAPSESFSSGVFSYQIKFDFGKDSQTQVTDIEVISEKDNYTLQKAYDNTVGAEYLECWGKFSNGSLFIMTTPLQSIRESANISNRFLTYVIIVALIIGCIIIYFVSRQVSKPLMKLANISKKMSNLDFEARYKGKEVNEIGILGNNINVLSEKLELTISELKTANLELQKDIEEKVKIDEMRKEFLSNVSHELKTPIALIQGYAEGLLEGITEDPESMNFYCDVIVDEANKMNKMVQQLLSLNHLEFGSDQVVLERFDITDLIQGVLNASNILIEQKEANIIFMHDEPVYVWGDEFKIEEVVTNYVTNALNHLDYEKEIVITMQRKDPSPIIDEDGNEVAMANKNKCVRISVFNTGDCIPEEDLNKVWIKFYKVDKARTREYGGSGIGLSIVKAIMDTHNKACGVENRENGVEFWFELDASND